MDNTANTMQTYHRGGHTVEFARPKIEPLMRGSQVWQLVEDWQITFDETTYVLPRGTTFDGASIPRFLWRVCGHPLAQPRLPIAIFHDGAYSALFPGLTREQADELYRIGLVAVGIWRAVAFVEWYAIRRCGGSHWEAVGDWGDD